jgi:tetratricopeptide (TPR) repeat protein
VHRNLASLLALEARHAEAIDVYRRGLSGLEARPATRVLTKLELGERVAATREMDAQLSTLMLATDRFTEAEPLIRRRLERDPDNVELRSDLARALSGMGRDAEAEEIYGTLLVEEGLAGTQLFNLGVALFRSSDFAGAAEAFRRLTESQPESRDAWFNYANALFAAEAWEALAAAGDRLIAVEPLGENAILITARAQLETGDRAAAVGTLALADAAPVYLDDLRMRRARATTRVEGRVTGNAADPGTSVRVRFVFYGERGEELGSETLRLAAPSPGEAAPFEVTFVMRADAYRYELVG